MSKRPWCIHTCCNEAAKGCVAHSMGGEENTVAWVCASFCLTLRRHRCYTPTFVAYEYCSDSDASRRGRAPVKLGALRRHSRGERAPVKLGALCPRSGRERVPMHTQRAYSHLAEGLSRRKL